VVLSVVVVVSGVVDAPALSRAWASGLHSGGLKVQFLLEVAERRASCGCPWNKVLHQKNERLRVGSLNRSVFPVPLGGSGVACSLKV
jgi:hypothetical protein